MVIVVDTLDECGALEHIRLIIQLLSQAKDFVSIRLKFFLTSRPELPIRLGFEDISGKYKDLVLHQIPKPVIGHDITAFLQHELSKIQKDYNKSVTSNRQLPLDWPGTENIQKLVDMAVPLFIFAATVCRFIQDRRFGGPKDQLARILEHQKNQKSNLDATYLPVLDQLVTGLRESEKREVTERFKQVVGSIVNLASPLSIPSLARLLGVPPDAIENQLDLLHSVLSVHPDSSIPVRLLHLSFHNFLVDPEKGREREKNPFWVDERQTHKLLAVQCLKLLSIGDTLKRDVCGLRLPGMRRSEVGQQTINACLPSEVQYACRYWVYHWKESKCLIRDGDIVNCFLTRHLLHWLEALGVLGRVLESIGMVNNLLDLLNPEESSEVSAFLRDTRRIILSHRSIIDESPLQVYYSAIVFVPEKSVVRKTFRDQFPAWLSPPPQVDSDWDACLQTLEDHSGLVTSVAFSPDAKQLASGSQDETIKIWDVSSGECLQVLTGHSSCVRSVVFSPNDTKRLASAGYDTIKIWDINTSKCLQTFEGHDGGVNSIAFSPDAKLLVSGSYYTVKIWNMDNGECLRTLRGHSYAVNSVAVSPNAQQLASASADCTVKIWGVNGGECLRTLEGHSRPVKSVAFSPTDTKQPVLASASRYGTIKIWDVNSGECLQTLEVDDGLNSIAFLLNTQLALGVHSNIEIWDRKSGKRIQTLKGHRTSVESVACSPDMKHFASASHDKTVKIWEKSSSEYMPAFDGHHSEWVSSITFSPNMEQPAVVSASTDGTIKIWDVSSGKCLQTLQGHRDGVNSAAFSPNTKQPAPASAHANQTIRLWDMLGSECTEIRHYKTVYNISFDINGLCLHTIIGPIGINASSTSSASVEATSTGSAKIGRYQGIAISSNGIWIAYDSRNIIWLTPKYRPTSSVVSGMWIAVGSSSGRVWICGVQCKASKED